MRVTSSRFAMSVISASLFLTSNLYAAAFQFYELGTPVMGTAGVGQAAEAYDASTSYFNPAAMIDLPGTQYLLGTQMIVPYAHFRSNAHNSIRGNNGGNAESILPGTGMYFSYCYRPDLKFGLSLTSPYAGFLNYNDGWVGRYDAQFIQLLTIDLNPVVAYKINDWISVGGGVVIEYAFLRQIAALPLPDVFPLIDGQVDVRVDNYSAGINLGVVLTPTQRTRIGIAYRSRINHRLKGDLTFLRLNFRPGVHTQLTIPNNVIVSVMQGMTENLTLLAEAGWSNWSTMQKTTLTVDGFSVNTRMDWKDTYRVGLGAQFQCQPTWLLQAGVSYDSSPTSPTKRVPQLPMDRQIRVGAGVIFNLPQGTQMGLSYEYINFGRAKIDRGNILGNLSGSYPHNYANFIQASINISV